MPFGYVTFWLVMFILFLIIELFTFQLVSIWFCAGSLAAMISAYYNLEFLHQIIIFICISILMIIVSKPLVKKYVNSKTIKTNADRIIGKECLVTQEINNIKGTGTVKVAGLEWSAKSYDDSVEIGKGQKVSVIDIKGVNAIVK